MPTVRLHFEGELDVEIDADPEDAAAWDKAIVETWEVIAAEELRASIYKTEEWIVEEEA